MKNSYPLNLYPQSLHILVRFISCKVFSPSSMSWWTFFTHLKLMKIIYIKVFILINCKIWILSYNFNVFILIFILIFWWLLYSITASFHLMNLCLSCHILLSDNTILNTNKNYLQTFFLILLFFKLHTYNS